MAPVLLAIALQRQRAHGRRGGLGIAAQNAVAGWVANPFGRREPTRLPPKLPPCASTPTARDAGVSSSRLYISASNRLETLAEQLADEMRRHPRDPLAPERIVVPHPALGRWLRMALATELGVAANLRVELPAEFAWDVMRETVPALAAERQFAPASLRWRIFDLLGGDIEDDQLRRYLADAEPRKRFELADRLAHVYDRCLLYRPTWIRAWQAGDAPHWQARLWLALCRTATAPCHWVDAVDAYWQAAAQLAAAPAPEQLELDLDADGERVTSRASSLRHGRHVALPIWTCCAQRRASWTSTCPVEPVP